MVAAAEPLVARIQHAFRPVASLERGSYAAECHVNESEPCPVSAMVPGDITAVFPGKGTRCLFESSPPYLFQVIPGSTDELVVHFDMGGGCWDEATANLGACLTGVAEVAREGMFDPSRASNAFAGYSFVIVGYCSGDGHGGDVGRSWTVPDGGRVEQRGYRNAGSALDWVKANFPKRLRSLVVSGSSAGSVGAQLWARKILQDLDYESAAVIADSFAGVFPAGVQGRQQKSAGLCQTDLLDAARRADCESGSLEVQRLFEDAMRAFPEVAFASIDSKIDLVQIAYYELVCITLLRSADFTLTPRSFVESLSEIYRRYNIHPNWVSYLVNSRNHMFLNRDIMYRTRPGSTVVKTSGLLAAGLKIAGVDLQGPETKLTTWLGGLPVRRGGSISSVCRGVVPHVAKPKAGHVLGGLLGGTLGSSLGVSLNAAKTSVRAGLQPLAQRGADVTGLSRCDADVADKTFSRSPLDESSRL